MSSHSNRPTQQQPPLTMSNVAPDPVEALVNLQSMFSASLDPEIIQSVWETHQGRLDKALSQLLEMSSTGPKESSPPQTASSPIPTIINTPATLQRPKGVSKEGQLFSEAFLLNNAVKPPSASRQLRDDEALAKAIQKLLEDEEQQQQQRSDPASRQPLQNSDGTQGSNDPSGGTAESLTGLGLGRLSKRLEEFFSLFPEDQPAGMEWTQGYPGTANAGVGVGESTIGSDSMQQVYRKVSLTDQISSLSDAAKEKLWNLYEAFQMEADFISQSNLDLNTGKAASRTDLLLQSGEFASFVREQPAPPLTPPRPAASPRSSVHESNTGVTVAPPPLGTLLPDPHGTHVKSSTEAVYSAPLSRENSLKDVSIDPEPQPAAKDASRSRLNPFANLFGHRRTDSQSSHSVSKSPAVTAKSLPMSASSHPTTPTHSKPLPQVPQHVYAGEGGSKSTGNTPPATGAWPSPQVQPREPSAAVQSPFRNARVSTDFSSLENLDVYLMGDSHSAVRDPREEPRWTPAIGMPVRSLPMPMPSPTSAVVTSEFEETALVGADDSNPALRSTQAPKVPPKV